MKGKKAALTAEGEELFALMFELGRIIKSEMTRADAAAPSFLHVETLRFIQEKGNPTMRDIAAYLKVTPPTATALIDSLVEDRIVERVTDSEDRRKVRLELSSKGEKLIASFKNHRTAAFARVFATLTASDRREFARILSIITRSHSSHT